MRADGPSLLGGLGACYPQKFYNLEVLKHHFSAFQGQILEKNIVI